MLTAGAVLLAGIGMIALGVLAQPMYDIGIVVVLIAGVGLFIRSIEWLRWLREGTSISRR